ncbi:PHP domain-containing protein, partial [Candidatus Peregrinibacteria bacterium]|nr:PHP domain-containing protein [Candidatus Peregrinibacteria bacterium]
VAEGRTKSSVILRSGVDVDLRVVDKDCFGAALHYFSGDKHHNIRIRDLAKKKGLKVSEYGVFKGDKKVGGKDEEDIFKAVGLPYITPEIRRDDGEIEYGLKHKKFPEFVELNDIKGDLHAHSTYSDGDNSPKEMAEEFMRNGYDYCAITDHSAAVGIVGGMDASKIKQQWKEVDKLNKAFGEKFKIFKGCEVDILKDGSLDFSDDILNELDIVIVSAHLHGRIDPDDQTKRLIRAAEHPSSMIMGHPTGRLLNKRAAMKFDLEKVIDACVANNVALEINSSPERLDLSEKHIKMAKDKGAKFAINTDAHGFSDMKNMEFGVGMGRRGWLEPKNVLNTYSLRDLTAYFKSI